MTQSDRARDVLALIREAACYEADESAHRTGFVIVASHVRGDIGDCLMPSPDRFDVFYDRADAVNAMRGYTGREPDGWTHKVCPYQMADTESANSDLAEWFAGWRKRAAEALMAYKAPDPWDHRLAVLQSAVDDLADAGRGLAVSMGSVDHEMPLSAVGTFYDALYAAMEFATNPPALSGEARDPAPEKPATQAPQTEKAAPEPSQRLFWPTADGLQIASHLTLAPYGVQAVRLLSLTAAMDAVHNNLLTAEKTHDLPEARIFTDVANDLIRAIDDAYLIRIARNAREG